MQPHLRAAATRGSAAYQVDQRGIALIVSRTGRQNELPFDNLVGPILSILFASQHGVSSRPATSPLNILQLILVHPEIMAQFMNDRQTDLFANFRLAGADRLNVFLIKHDVIGPGS